MQYSCGKCNFTWKMSEVENGAIGTPEKKQDYAEGYHCPNCESTDISGVDL